MSRDDDFFNKIEDMFEQLEDKMNEIQEEQNNGENPFDNPFGGPFGDNPFGDNPFGEGGPFGDNPFGGSGQTAETESAGLLFDVFEDEDEVVVVADLPGFSEDQISLTADPNRVRIQAEARTEQRRESISHVFNLPVEVDPDGADANLENGVLTVRFPRVGDDDQTTISIE